MGFLIRIDDIVRLGLVEPKDSLMWGANRSCDKSDRLRGMYVACMSAFMLNDLVYWLLAGSFAIYVADWCIRLVMLLFLWAARHSLPPMPKRRGSDGMLALLAVALVAFCIACEPISARLGSGWMLFRWMPIENVYIWILDLTLGLAMVAIVEEVVSRRLALAVLPGPMWARVVVSSILFGMMHWGLGYGHMVETTVIGLAFATAYAWTGSLKLVIASHYAVNLLIFGLGVGEL